MQPVRGIPHPQTEPAQKCEVRWIERLQQRVMVSPSAPIAVDAAEAGAWIRRLQERLNRSL